MRGRVELHDETLPTAHTQLIPLQSHSDPEGGSGFRTNLPMIAGRERRLGWRRIVARVFLVLSTLLDQQEICFAGCSY